MLSVNDKEVICSCANRLGLLIAQFFGHQWIRLHASIRLHFSSPLEVRRCLVIATSLSRWVCSRCSECGLSDAGSFLSGHLRRADLELVMLLVNNPFLGPLIEVDVDVYR